MSTHIKLLFISLFIILNNMYLYAQDYKAFPTESAEWEVIRCFYFFQPGWHDIYQISMEDGDTLYQGKSYNKLFITQHLKHGPNFDSIYPTEFFGGIREENKRIYIFQKWASVDTTEHLIYDFNFTNIGDTIYTSCLAGASEILFGHVVTAVDSVLIGQNYHKRLLLQDPYNSWNSEYWIEGVGSSWGLPFASFWSITDNSYDITCFYKDQTFMYANPDPQYAYCLAPLPEFVCDTLQSATQDEAFNSVLMKIYPNPFSSSINILLNSKEEWSLTIYDIQGISRQNLTFYGDQNTLDLSFLNKGVYYLKCSSKKGQLTKIFIKTES